MKVSKLPAVATCVAIAVAVLVGVPTPASGADTAIAAKGLTKEQFAALPDTAVVEIKGKTYTAGELRALGARSAATHAARLPALREKAKAKLESTRAAFQAIEKARVDNANARLKSQFSGAHQVPVASLGLQEVPPAITSVQGTVEPGATVYIQGKNFGGEAGRVLLKGLPGGDRTLAQATGYTFPWMPNGIAVVIPDVEKVLDQMVSLVVVRKDGAASATKSVQFKAALEVLTAFPIQILACGKDTTYDACLSFDFFEGSHEENTVWETDGVGCDTFQVFAKPPWVFDSWAISDTSSGASLGNPGNQGSGQSDQPRQWNMCWTVQGAGPYSGNNATYVGYYMIRGPKGVPSR